MKVANSISRVAVPSGLFGEQGSKSKQLYDFLYQQTRGAVVPRRRVRIPKDKLMRGAGIGSEVTLRNNLQRLKAARLVEETVVPGTHGGNEYEVFLPEEVVPGGATPSSPSSDTTGSSTRQDREGVETLEPRASSPGPSGVGATASGGPQTSLKDVSETDDEAFAGHISLLKKATKDVTGKDSSPAEAGNWTEVAQVLVDELRAASARTTVSSVPAFLAEHLRRRLSRPAPAPPARGATAAGPPPPLPAAEPPTDEDLIGMFVNLLHSGLSIEEVGGQFLASVEPSRWPELKGRVLERYEAEKGVTVSPPASGG